MKKRLLLLVVTALMLVAPASFSFASDNYSDAVIIDDDIAETESDTLDETEEIQVEEISIVSVEEADALSDDLATIAETEISGTCGDDLTWILDSEGTLTISGTGAMEDYSETNNAPWYTKSTSINTVIIDSGVTSIGDYAFYNCNRITNAILPAGIESIGTYAFAECKSLTNVVFPDTITTISGWAFFECVTLSEISLPANIEFLGEFSFGMCNGLVSVIIPNNKLTSIGESVFYGCSSLKSITIPEGIKTIDLCAFAFCTELSDITFSEGVESIAENAFMNCTSLTTVTFPKSLTTLGSGAFIFCNNLTTVVFQDGIYSIGNTAFCECTNLTSITLPESIFIIDEAAFRDISALKDVYYLGSIASWNLINIDSDNDSLLEAVIHCSDGVIAADLSGYTVTFSYDSCVYDGNEKLPAVVVEKGVSVLENGNDYMVVYSDNVNVGTAKITITGVGNYTGKIEKTFTIKKADQTVTASAKSSSIKVGDTTQITASGQGTIGYSSSNTSVATVSSGGVVTGVGTGTATITVKAAGNDNYNSASTTVSITVAKASQTVTASAKSYSIVAGKTTSITASGQGTITYSSSNTSVATVSSSGVVTGKKPGKVTITVNAAGNSKYDAAKTTVSVTVTLGSAKISSLTNTSTGIKVKWSKVSGSSGYYIYRKTSSGSYKKIKTVSNASTVSYTDTAVKNKNGTTYIYKVVPYSGSAKGSGTEKKTVRLTGTSLTSVKNSSSKKMAVKWTKVTKVTGYQIQYSTSKTFASGNETKTVSGASKSSKTLTELTKGKTYYVRIRTYKTVSGKKYYSAWSSKLKVKITK